MNQPVFGSFYPPKILSKAGAPHNFVKRRAAKRRPPKIGHLCGCEEN
jgi:hypothetical protein